MIRDYSVHPSDTTLENYVMDRLKDEAQLATCEEHLLVCHDCQDRAAAWDRYVGAIKAALEQAGTYFVHRTQDGPILIIPRGSDAGWTVAIEGLQLCAGATGSAREAAIRDAEEEFRQMFPEHECTTECGWRMRES
jgi:hypothetical protein